MRPIYMFLCLLASITLVAQDNQVKISVIMPNRIMEKSVRCKKIFSMLDSLKKNTDKNLTTMGNEIQRLNHQLQSPSVSEVGKESIRKQLRDRDFEYKKFQQDSQIEIQRVEEETVTQFENEITPLINDLAKEQKLQIVFQLQPGLTAYIDPKFAFEFSDEVIKRYDAKYQTQVDSGNQK